MTADLTPYRGKRALVCGLPHIRSKKQQAWLDASNAALRALGIKETESWDGLQTDAEAITKFRACAVVLICGSGPVTGSETHFAKLAGIPAPRVRRDGSVEVDQCD